MKRGEDGNQNLVGEGAIVLHGCLSKAFKGTRANFECDLLHSYVWLEQVRHDLLDVWQFLGCLLGILAHECRQECA